MCSHAVSFSRIMRKVREMPVLSESQEQFRVTNLDTGERLDMRFECTQQTRWRVFCPSASYRTFLKVRETATVKLWAAAEINDVSCVDELISAGASVHAKGIHQWTALHRAAASGHLEMCELLLINESIVNDLSNSGQTPLHLATISGRCELVLLLIQWRANVNLRDKDGNTPLHYAAMYAHSDIVKMLMDKKGNFYAANNDGNMPGDLAGDFCTKVLLPHKTDFARVPICGALLRNSRKDMVERLLSRTSKQIKPTPYAFVKDRMRAIKRKRVKDYRIIGLLGNGSFAKVFLAKHIPTGHYYALKVIGKALIDRRDIKAYLLTEKQILSQVQHPFIVHMHCSFQTSSHVIMVLSYCAGGTLGDLISQARKLRESHARILLCEIILALGELHSRCICYRDMKPANVLLTADGHVSLCDFGLAKQAVPNRMTRMTLCGTPAYLSPEMLRGEAHGFEVDWYGLGVLFYHMITGSPPYFAETQEELFANIAAAPLKIPRHVSPSACNLLHSLLHRDPLQRLGFKGATEVMRHPYFSNVDWDKIYQRKGAVEKPAIKEIIAIDSEVDLDQKSLEGSDISGWTLLDRN